MVSSRYTPDYYAYVTINLHRTKSENDPSPYYPNSPTGRNSNLEYRKSAGANYALLSMWIGVYRVS